MLWQLVYSLINVIAEFWSRSKICNVKKNAEYIKDSLTIAVLTIKMKENYIKFFGGKNGNK